MTERKNVVLANTTYRFLTKDGWTRGEVAEYLKSKDIRFVIPRWYDSAKDKSLDSSLNILENELPYNDCDYFAIYHLSEEAELDLVKLKEEHDFNE